MQGHCLGQRFTQWLLQWQLPLQEDAPLHAQVEVGHGVGQQVVLGQHGLWVEQPATKIAAAVAATARPVLILMDNILISYMKNKTQKSIWALK